MTQDVERASKEAWHFLEEYLFAQRKGVGRILSCQHVAPTEDGHKLQIAFAVEPGFLVDAEEVDEAIRECVDELARGRPDLAGFGVTWFKFRG